MKHSFFFHVENIRLPEGLPYRLHIRVPTCRVADLYLVVQEVWKLPNTIELWLGVPGNAKRLQLTDPEAVVEPGIDVWIRGRARRKPDVPNKDNELSTQS